MPNKPIDYSKLSDRNSGSEFIGMSQEAHNVDAGPRLNNLVERDTKCHFCKEPLGECWLNSRGRPVCGDKKCRFALAREEHEIEAIARGEKIA